MALKFLYCVTLGREWVVEKIACPKAPKKLPVVLSQDEMARFLDALRNPKHRALLMTAYAGGLRLSEVARLPRRGHRHARMVIHVRQGKGRKDRDVMLSPRLLDSPPRVLGKYRPGRISSPDDEPDQPISPRTVQMVCERALEAAGLSKHVTCIPCGTVSRPTCSKPAPTSGPSRSCSATAASAPPPSTPTSPRRRCNDPQSPLDRTRHPPPRETRP